jgi:DNA-binding MarR family transcriptional regulator
MPHSDLNSKKRAGVLEEEAFISVIRSAEVLQRGVTELLNQYGLSSTQYNALRILRGAGSPGLSCNEIADRLINRDPDVTRLLGRLQRRKLVRSGRDKSDRRVILTSITDAGRELVNTLDGPILALHHTQLGHLGKSRLESLTKLLRAAREPAA